MEVVSRGYGHTTRDAGVAVLLLSGAFGYGKS